MDAESHSTPRSQDIAEVELGSPISNDPNDRILRRHSSLPPTDRGKDAWLALAAVSAVQIPIWGFSYATGVLQEYYAHHPHDGNINASGIAIIGTTATGGIYISTPIISALLARWPFARRYCGPLGAIIITGSFILASFATQEWELVVTEGVLSAIGGGLLYALLAGVLDEWFPHRRGFSYGVMGAAKAATGTVIPFITEAAVSKYGVATSARAWAVTVLLLTAPSLYFMRGRLPSPRSTSVRRIDTTFLRQSTFWMHEAGNIIQSLGYFLPSAYLPVYAVELGLPATIGTLMTSLINGTTVIGSLTFGVLNDHFRVTSVILLSSVGSALAVFLFWGLSSQIALLVMFSILYGFFAGGFSSTYSGVLTELKSSCDRVDTVLVFGLLAGGRGIGNVISGPLSVALVSHDNWLHNGKSWGYNTEYGPMILFTGVSMALGGCSWAWKFVRSN